MRQPDTVIRPEMLSAGIDVTGTQSTARYGGASPCTLVDHHCQLGDDTLTNWKAVELRSNFLVSVVTRAAAF